jgi:hypothetical protein
MANRQGAPMANVPVAFYVLSTFFGIYFVAAFLRSRPIRKSRRGERSALTISDSHKF